VQFWSRYDRARYVVEPTYWEIVGPHRQQVKGIAAEFNDHLFDSDAAQALNRWSDEVKAAVEEYLQAHYDFGKTMRLVTSQDTVMAGSIAAVPTCLFRVTIDGEVDACGRPAVSEDGYCQKHASMVEDSPMDAPNRIAKASA
jgi:hypothetical protein